MIRAAFLIILAAAIAAIVFGIAGEPGRATLEWLGWRVSMTAAAAVCATLILGFLAVGLWRLGLWILETPRRNAAAQAAHRRQQGTEALTRGFLAAAGGDGSQARRLARLAADLASDMPGLTRVLAAQAAEAAGDAVAAQAAYTAMLGFPEMRLAGHRGLMMTALAQGDRYGALAQARAAFSLPHTARWAWRALLEDRLEAGDWPAALDLVQRGVDHKVVSPISADRARCALLAASAASLELAALDKGGDRKTRAEALEFASQAVKLDPGFTPGVVIAARLMAADRKAARATPLIEQAWRLSPHPALWLLWRDLRTTETPKERAARFAALAALNPAHRESRFLKVEEALLLRDPAAARAAARPLVDSNPDGDGPSARVCGLMARVANLAGEADEARAWMARGAGARHEPAWTDIDPKGRAFAYGAADWARLCATFSETGELIHPRLARGEPVITELPELPTAYETPSAFLEAAAFARGRPADDPGDPEDVGLIDGAGFGGAGFEGEDFDGPDWGEDPAPTRPVLSVVPSPPPPRRPRRRLASPPSPAK